MSVDILKQNSVTGWSLGNVLTVTYDTELTNLHRFKATVPVDYVHNANNKMTFRLSNFTDLYVPYLGDVTTLDTSLITKSITYGYTSSYIYIYVYNDGEEINKYNYWLPTGATTQEKTLFLNKHTFILDYKNT